VKDHEGEDREDHEGIIGKIAGFTASAAIIAGAVASGPGALSHYHLAGAQPSAAYGVATTLYSGPDHTDTGADFPLAALPQPGTAAIRFNILGPGD
jgi:hypothetical protein